MNSDTAGNGHVSRNIRVSLLAADLVEPYLSFVGVNNVALTQSILPLTGLNCMQMNAMRVPQTLTQVTVEWTVGCALEIDETGLYFGKWNDVVLASGMDSLTQPATSVERALVVALTTTVKNGTGYFSKYRCVAIDYQHNRRCTV